VWWQRCACRIMRLKEMAEIRILVADDEPLARRGVRQLLAPHADMRVVGESRNGPDTLRALEELKPDLLFLDVQMPEMDGFAVLRRRGADRMPTVIFVTAHDQFAVQAFEAHAIDYLVKPLKVERFEAALGRAREHLRLMDSVALAARLKALLAAERAQREKEGIERLVVPTELGYRYSGLGNRLDRGGRLLRAAARRPNELPTSRVVKLP
jgi:two-component system LytT family response regulator